MGEFMPIVILLGVAALVCAAMVTLSWVLGPKKVTPYKASPYECGVEPSGSARERFPIKFYLVAMLFILFDIEVVFLYPWAVVYRELKLYGFVVMLLFIDLVLAGFFYILKKGVLEWAQESTTQPDGR